MLTAYDDYRVEPGPLKVIDIQTLVHANYFSAGPVVVMRLDLGRYDEVFSNNIPGFYEKLEKILPSLYEHHCSEGKKGGFFQRVKSGTLLGHITEHTAIELQALAGMDVSFGKTRFAGKKGVYNVVFRFIDEKAGIYAGKAAVNLINSLLLDSFIDTGNILSILESIRETRLLGPSTQAVVDEAARRKIPWLRLDDYNLVQLGSGKYQKRIRATLTSDTGFIAVETVDDKFLTSRILKDAGLPVPETVVAETFENAVSFLKEINSQEKIKIPIPITIKPCRGALGNGVTNSLSAPENIKTAHLWATSFDKEVLAQETISGNSFRILVIDYKFIAAVKRVPPSVIGDGEQTIWALIEKLNDDKVRGIGDKFRLAPVKIDAVTKWIIKTSGYTLDTVLPEKKILQLKRSGNLNLGGSAVDVTDDVCEENRYMAQRAAQVTGLNVAGIDMIAPTLSRPITENGGAIIEINSAPDFRIHINPTAGRGRNVAKPFLDMLFPKQSQFKAPLFSITGSSGKTETAKLLTHCLDRAGYMTGTASSKGLFIGKNAIKKGNMTSAKAASLILKDPAIDCAVIETPCETIARTGLGYEYADFGIVLNVNNDRTVECDYLFDIDDVAYAKSCVAEQVYDDGFAILNADDEKVMEMKSRIYSRTILFSKHEDNPYIQAHIEKGEIAVLAGGDEIIIMDNNEKIRVIESADEFCLISKFCDSFAYDVLLASVAALYGFGMPIDMIKNGMSGRIIQKFL